MHENLAKIQLDITHGFIDENFVYYPQCDGLKNLNHVVYELLGAMKDVRCQFTSARFIWSEVCYECTLVDGKPHLTALEIGFTVTQAWFMNIPNLELKVDRRREVTQLMKDAYRAPQFRHFDESGNRRD